MPLTQVELNEAGCGTPNCGHDHSILHVHSRCHTYSKGVNLKYIKALGELVAECRQCGKLIARFKVAEE